MNVVYICQADSSQIVGRLMQIRDYIKQAGAMMDSLKKSGDPVSIILKPVHVSQ